MAIAFPQCESHPGRRLTDHLEDVASRLEGTFVEPVGLFHDLGKATEYFQDYLHDRPVSDPVLTRHSLLGAEIFLRYMIRAVDAGNCTIEDAALRYAMIKRHHGGLDNLVDAFSTPDSQQILPQFASLDWQGLTEWLQMRVTAIESSEEPNHARLRVKLSRALKGHTSRESAMARFQQALVWFGTFIEADRDSAAGYLSGMFVSADRCFAPRHVQQFRSGLSTGAAAAELNAARNRLFDAASAAAITEPLGPSRLWSLTAPTGSGKTLAGVEWALRRRNARANERRGPIVYALPFTSIIDQTAAALEQMYGNGIDESILSVHHHQSEPGSLSLRGEASLARVWTEGWRADVVCTTFVQVANALFHGTPWDSRRLKNLAGSFLILDEVQAMPAHLWEPFAHALKSLATTFGTEVLLMTATQPALFEDSAVTELAPLGYSDAAVFDRYDVRIDLAAQLSLGDLAGSVEAALQDQRIGSCLIILNTIREALDLFQILSARPRLSAFNFCHLSTNLRPKDRRIVLDSLRRVAGQRTVLVSTQVVEAGMDLSFDIVFRALAPVDSIVQAAGRCNRHGNGVRGLVRVFELSGNSAIRIYGNVHIDVARSILGGAARLLTEPELRALVQRYYLTLRERTSQKRAKLIFDAVQMLEFANLRGEGERDLDREKRVILIDEDASPVPHFIEMDDSDAYIWFRFRSAVEAKNWPTVRRLRKAVAQRTVEVPASLAYPLDKVTSLAYVGHNVAPSVYSTVTGWKR